MYFAKLIACTKQCEYNQHQFEHVTSLYSSSITGKHYRPFGGCFNTYVHLGTYKEMDNMISAFSTGGGENTGLYTCMPNHQLRQFGSRFAFSKAILCQIITWWWVIYSCRNSLLRQKSPCFDRKSPSGSSCCWTYPLYKIFRVKIAIRWSVYKLCIQKCYTNCNEIFFSLKKIFINT